MARNVKLIPLSFDDKAEVLRQLQGKIHLEKTLTWTNVNRTRKSEMRLPKWFVEEHGDKIRKSVILRSQSSTKSWIVNLSISYSRFNSIQVKAVGGWKAFATFNGLLEGDTLIFSLTAVSEFEVYLFRGKAGNRKEYPSQPPSKQSNDSKLARKKAKQSHKQLAADGNIQGSGKSNGLIAKRKTVVGEERSLSASGQNSTSCSLTSYSIDLHLLSESENVRADSSCGWRHDSQNGHKPAIDHNKLDLKSESDTRDGPAQQTVARMKRDYAQQAFAFQRNPQLPSFYKKLTVSNFFTTNRGQKKGLLEIPTKFWKTLGSRLGPLVKLQGIREESPMRTVACSPTLQANRYWRFLLKAGWRDFAIDNNLEVGQVLQFTLAGYSFFVVRRVDS